MCALANSRTPCYYAVETPLGLTGALIGSYHFSVEMHMRMFCD